MNDDPLEPGSDATLRPPLPANADLRSYVLAHLVAVPLGLALLAWFVQHSSVDMAITNLFVDPASHRFAWHDSALLDVPATRRRAACRSSSVRSPSPPGRLALRSDRCGPGDRSCLRSARRCCSARSRSTR
jgi:hypothetical protein